MHIGFDISQTGAIRAGCGQFAHGMIAAMLRVAPEHRYSLYPSFGDFYFDVNMPAANPYAGAAVSYGPRHATLEEATAFWARADLDAALGMPDIVHANNYWCPTTLRSARLVYTLYDLSFFIRPGWSTEVNRTVCGQGVSRAAVHADRIVAISEATRRHYLEVFPQFPEDCLKVVHPPSRFSVSPPQPVRPAAAANLRAGGYWLSVGTIEPRKNQLGIAEAYARYLASGGTPMPLVFAGGYGWLMEDFQKRLEALGVLPHVVITGYVSDPELAWLYANCRANIYLSHFEGFGLPVLEGMQFGAPTIAARTTAIPEVAGDAAMLIAPDDTEAAARAMLMLDRSGEERARLAGEARQRAKRFDDAASARALLAIYEEAAASPKRTPRA